MRRVISAACFPDRVLHHAILNLAEPRFERMLVDSTFACRRGKGVHLAIEAVQQNLRRWPWFVQVDVESYFPSIDHATLRRLLLRRFKGASFLALLDRIIDRGATALGRGLPIGALTSQHFANAYLDPADRMLLEHTAVCAHVRYMDDIVWWCTSRGAALETLESLRHFLRRDLRLELKSAACARRSERGLAYCGFRVKPGIVLASSRKLSRYRRGLARISRVCAGGSIDEVDLQRALDGLVATLKPAQTLEFRRRHRLEHTKQFREPEYHADLGCEST